VPHEYLARPWGLKLPVRNNFWLTFLASLIPDLSYEYLWFADDYILLQEVSPQQIFKIRAIEDLAKVTTRGQGRWKDALWRTHDTLFRLGYGSLNFEGHLPHPYNKRLIWEAFCEFQDLVTVDRFYGLLVHTAVFRYALKQRENAVLESQPGNRLRSGAVSDWPCVSLQEEGRYVGFHNRPPTLAEIQAKSHGRTFLNFDDVAFNEPMRQFLEERFAEPSKYEVR